MNMNCRETKFVGDQEVSLVRHVFRSDLSEAKWLKEDFVDFLSTIDLRVALFLPTNSMIARGEVSLCG